MPAAADIEEFKDHIDVASDAEDAALNLHLEAATEVAEETVGPIVNRTVRARVKVDSSGVVFLPESPVVSITSMTPVRGAAVDVATLDVDEATGIVTKVTGWLLPGRYDVVYVAGRAEDSDSVPAALRLAVCLIAKQMWETRRGRGHSGGRGGTLASNGPLPDERVPAGFLVPHRARALMEPYRNLPVA